MKKLLKATVVFLCSVGVFAVADTTTTSSAAAPAIPADSTAGVLSAASVPIEFGRLNIITDPADVLVVLDSVERGKTPLTIDSIKPGEHQVQLKKKGYYIKKATILVAAGKVQDVSFELLKPARIVIASTPVGATVSLNGTKAGVTPFVNEKQAPGEYTLGVSAEGYLPVETRVVVKNGAMDSLYYELKPVSPAADAPAADRTEPAKKQNLGVVIASVVVFVAFSLIVLLVEVNQ